MTLSSSPSLSHPLQARRYCIKASPAKHGTSEERYRLLQTGTPPKNHPYYGKQWINFTEELHRHLPDLRSSRLSTRSIASVPRRRDMSVDGDDDEDGQGSCHAAASPASQDPVRQASASGGSDPRKQGSFSSLDSSLVLARSSSSPREREGSTPLSLPLASAKVSSGRHSLDVAAIDHDAALHSSSERPSGALLAQAVSSRQMQLERLQRECEEEERLLDQFEAQEWLFRNLKERKARILARREAAAGIESGSLANDKAAKTARSSSTSSMQQQRTHSGGRQGQSSPAPAPAVAASSSDHAELRKQAHHEEVLEESFGGSADSGSSNRWLAAPSKSVSSATSASIEGEAYQSEELDSCQVESQHPHGREQISCPDVVGSVVTPAKRHAAGSEQETNRQSAASSMLVSYESEEGEVSDDGNGNRSALRKPKKEAQNSEGLAVVAAEKAADDSEAKRRRVDDFGSESRLGLKVTRAIKTEEEE